MVAEHGSSSTMTMNGFDQLIANYQSVINPADQGSILLHTMMSNIHAGFQTFHNQVVDINTRVGGDDIKQKIADMEAATQVINSNLQLFAGQMQQHQAALQQQQPQQHQHKKGILEYKVIQNIKPLTGSRSQFRQWHQKLINALSTIKEDHAEIIRAIEKSMDVGDKIQESLDELDSTYLLDDFNKDLTCILMDKCEGEAYDKIKGLQNLKGAEIYMIIYRWLTEISGLGFIHASGKFDESDPHQERIRIRARSRQVVRKSSKIRISWFAVRISTSLQSHRIEKINGWKGKGTL